MKKIAIINIIAILGLIFFSTGCTEDWEEMNRHEKTQALGALRRIRTLTRSTLHKYGVTVD